MSATLFLILLLGAGLFVAIMLAEQRLQTRTHRRIYSKTRSRKRLFVQIAALVFFVGGMTALIIATVFAQKVLYVEEPLRSAETLRFPNDPQCKQHILITGRVNILATFILLIGDVPVVVDQVVFRGEKMNLVWERYLYEDKIKITIKNFCLTFDTVDYCQQQVVVDIVSDSMFQNFYGNMSVGSVPQQNIAARPYIISVELKRLENLPGYVLLPIHSSQDTYKLMVRLDTFLEADGLRPISQDRICVMTLADYEAVEDKPRPHNMDVSLYSPESHETAIGKMLARYSRSPLPVPVLLIALCFIGGFALRRYLVGLSICIVITLAVLVVMDKWALEDNLSHIEHGTLAQRALAVSQCDATFFFWNASGHGLRDFAQRNGVPPELRPAFERQIPTSWIDS